MSTNSDAHEIVTKLISTGKSQRSIKSLMRYLARDGREKIYNDLGQEILSIDAHIKEGNYLPDSKNFSKKYKEANTKKKAKFKEADKYYKNQIHHFVLSFHYNDCNMGDEKFHKIASAFGHIFSADEHRFAYAIHKNKNPHIHYMIDSKSASGKQLHINRHELRNIRKIAAEICLENGLNYTAREIRERDSKQIAEEIFLTLYAEKPSAAFYYANNKKGLFGELIDVVTCKNGLKASGYMDEFTINDRHFSSKITQGFHILAGGPGGGEHNHLDLTSRRRRRVEMLMLECEYIYAGLNLLPNIFISIARNSLYFHHMGKELADVLHYSF